MARGAAMPRNPRRFVVWSKVTIDFKGRTIAGLYCADREMVTVRYGGDEKYTQVGWSPPTTIAKMLLRELANKAEKEQL
jgi:hypothetical protein